MELLFLNKNDLCQVLGISNWKTLIELISSRSSVVRYINSKKTKYCNDKKILRLPLIIHIDLHKLNELTKQVLIPIPSFNQCPGGWQTILQKESQISTKVRMKYGDLVDNCKHIGKIERGHLLAAIFKTNIKVQYINPLPNHTDNFFSKKI